MLWLGGAIAAVIASQTLIWQQVHGWPQLQMASVVGCEAEALYGGRAGIAVQLILFAGVWGVALVGYGLWRLLRTAETFHALPVDQQQRTAIVGESYIVAPTSTDTPSASDCPRRTA
jgi:hypothetical protein